MPTYGYVCTACGHDFEQVQAMTDSALTACPECTGALRKIFHPVGIAFKGSGFYRNDSRAAPPNETGEKSTEKDSAKPAAASSDSDSGSGAATKSDGKAETKTEKKAEPKAGGKSEPASSAGSTPANTSGKSSGSTNAPASGNSKPSAATNSRR